jgi:hypothetical protein
MRSSAPSVGNGSSVGVGGAVAEPRSPVVAVVVGVAVARSGLDSASGLEAALVLATGTLVSRVAVAVGAAGVGVGAALSSPASGLLHATKRTSVRIAIADAARKIIAVRPPA